MTAAWVAGDVRARALLERRLGARRTRELAALPSLAGAQRVLLNSPYRRDIELGRSLADTEHAVAAAVLWHLRVLAGWQPRTGARMVRLLAGGFEVANIAEHARALRGAMPGPPFRLGALDIAWSRLRTTASPAELRRMLARSPWGDPNGDTPSDIVAGVQLVWADRVANGVPDAARWASRAAALLLARRLLLEGATPPAGAVEARAERLVGRAALRAKDLPSFAAALPARARFAVVETTDPGELWRAESRWWAEVERDGRELLRRSGFGPAAVIGTVALLAVDAWRCRAALQIAAAGGRPLEAYDALA
ncbi:V-type ATPase subunit [Nocardia australiensis]|uniref:V-type ATPase subunit n=1 Tax=Nocardia australiensis TaxID=2887191 RepID=UPI001D14B797|nr:V-type ATPase subunit [Nocardia australiensis]